MRLICEAHLAEREVCPVVILTRELVRPHLDVITVIPIYAAGRGLSTEVPLGAINGVIDGSVAECDAVTTIPVTALGTHLGFLLPMQELSLTAALRSAFDLEW